MTFQGIVLAALLLILQAPAPTSPQQEQQAEKASIEGVILRSGTGEPLPRAQVTLTRIMPESFEDGFFIGDTAESLRIPQVMTESDGKFVLKDLEQGQYRLTVSRNGYASQSYGQRTPNGPGTTINLIPGQSIKNVTFRMVQGGIVTGRVRDPAGEPVAGVEVSLMRSGYDFDGKKSLTTIQGARTDDRGEYRFFWIAPGRYYVKVGQMPAWDPDQRNVIEDRSFPSTYYPGTLDSSRAIAIELQPGAELGGIDVALPQPVTYRIRGRIVDQGTGKPPKGVSIALVPKQAESIAGGFVEEQYRTEYNSATGAFEVRRVVPGAYWLGVSVQSNLNEPLSPNVVAEARTGNDLISSVFKVAAAAQIPIDMPASDLNDVSVTLSRGISIPVQLNVEGQELSAVPNLDKIRVHLEPESQNWRIGKEGGRFNASGVAMVDNVVPGLYRAYVNRDDKSGLYVKEIRHGRTDALNDKWEITEQTSGVLSVVLSNKVGRIEGTLTDAASSPVSGAHVILIPDEREQKRLYRTTTTDHAGHFKFENLPPGDYRVFSWEALEPMAYYDRDVLSQYETQGKAVRLQESSKETIDLRIIPAPKP